MKLGSFLVSVAMIPLLFGCESGGSGGETRTTSPEPKIEAPGPVPQIPDVNPPGPPPPPSPLSVELSISSPRDEATITGTVTIASSAAYTIAADISTASLLVDDVVVATADSVAAFHLDTRGLSAGRHVVAVDLEASRGEERVETRRTVAINVAATEMNLSVHGAPAPNPALPPAPGRSTGEDVAIEVSAQRELVIRGTDLGDEIEVTQDGSRVIVRANGEQRTFDGPFNGIEIDGGSFDDWIFVDYVVEPYVTIRGGEGDNVLENYAPRGTIISIGSGRNWIEGNGVDTAYWVNPPAQDTVYASAAEIAGKYVRTVTEFYQPWSSDPQNADYVRRALDGPSIRPPTDIGETLSYRDHSLFGPGATMEDVNQGGVGDCYFLAAIQSMANQSPDSLRRLVADLGDGTYVVNLGADFVRVDARFSGRYAHPGTSGDIWAMVMEKAFAYFRRKANTYASLGWGNPVEPWYYFGLTRNWGNPSRTDDRLNYNALTQYLAVNSAVTVITGATWGLPLVASHVYSVVGTMLTSNGEIYYLLRNPWGYDGFGGDTRPSDGLVTIGAAAFRGAVIEWEATL